MDHVSDDFNSKLFISGHSDDYNDDDDDGDDIDDADDDGGDDGNNTINSQLWPIE